MVSRFYSLLRSTLILLLAGLPALPVLAQTAEHADKPSTDSLSKLLESLPASFRRNMGQWGDGIIYSATTGDAAARFLRNGVSFAYTREVDDNNESDRLLSNEESAKENELHECLVWNVVFEGADAEAAIEGENEAPGPVSYLRGNDPALYHTRVPEAAYLRYHDLYPKIDLHYSNVSGALKYDYIVRPGGDPSAIRMRCDGIEGLQVNNAGELEITTAWGVTKEAAPIAWQVIEGRRQSVDVRYTILNDTTFGFRVHGGYRPGYELVIDPVILGWSTFIGGESGGDGYLLDIALDAQGNIYGSGHYNNGFPTTPGVYQRFNNGEADIFVFKLNRSGSKLLYATYIGGRDNDSATGLVVTKNGEAIICGTTLSSDFPATSGAFGSQLRGNSDLVLAKLNSEGSKLIFSTFVGGRSDESRARIALDSSGDIYLGGVTSSFDFPVTANIYDGSYGGSGDAVIARFSADGATCRFATYLGTAGNDTLTAIAADANGSVVAVGTTSSTRFPVTPGVIDPTGITNRTSGWLTRLSDDGRSLLSSTLLRAYPRRVVIDPTGDVIVAGDLSSGNSGFSSTPGVFGPVYGGDGDAFLLKVSQKFDALRFASYLGGAGTETVTGLTLAPNGDILVGGSVYHSLSELQSRNFTSTFPVTACAFDKTHTYDPNARYFNGEFEGFLTRVNSDATRLLYSTLIGGKSHDYKVNMVVPNSPSQEVIVSLTTHSPDFPITSGAFQTTKFNGDEDQPVVLVLKPTVTPYFHADTMGCGQVAFTDSSFGNCVWSDSTWKPNSWRWDFGDSTTSTEQSPMHEYQKPGTYKVKLIVDEPRDSITKVVVVKSARDNVPVRLHVDRSHHATLGSDITIPVILDDNTDTLRARSIAITFRYDTTMMSPLEFDDDQLERIVSGTALEDWKVQVKQPQPGTLVISATAPAGEVLHGPDTLLWLDFTTFLRANVTTIDDSIWTSELPISATLDGAYCTRLETSPGQLTLNLCGLQYRLIEMMEFSNKLGSAQPNPFNPTTQIPFSLTFDGPTRLEIFNASGEQVAVLLNASVQAGSYVIEWNATSYPSGLYYYRLSSGQWSQTRRMVLVK